jgi:galactarate dehydratase
MTASLKNKIIQITPADNVGIAASSFGIEKDTILPDGSMVKELIPMGHKVALKNIQQGEAIIRYGHCIGVADKNIEAGYWVNENNISLSLPPDLDSIPLKNNYQWNEPSLDNYTFQGYKNTDGSVGTKNILGVTTSVQCVAGLTEIVVKKIKEKLLPKYPNVDDAVALNHTYGCGVAINAPAAIIPIRTIQNIATNPNFGGELLVLGLGCEKLRPERLTPTDNKEALSSSIVYMQDESFVGFESMVAGILNTAEKHLKKLNERRRETCPASDLVVGMQCGGSDAFSGITANPVAGIAADLIVRAGGSVMFSEVTEVRDAIHLLVQRTNDEKVAQALIDEMRWYDAYLLSGGADRSANTSPGNKKGGLSTIVEKALGSIVKSGSSPIADVLGPGEKIKKKGLIFAATPASDFVCGTLQLAAGMNIHVFMTGRGTPYGLSMVPVIKVSTNEALSSRWFDLIDFDAGSVVTGNKTIEELGWELFHLILKVASGEQKVAADVLELHNDLVLFNPGPLT